MTARITLILLLNLTAFLSYASDGKSQSDSSMVHVSINLNEKLQTIDGWGGSLCWWANIIGGYSDEKIKTACDWITDPVAGLNMNIFRFNIGGGDAPGHHHLREDGGAMPGYRDSLQGRYEWTRDENQRKVLKQLIASRIANTGKNDVRLIAFSNSPPWWMTVSGCVSGSTDGKTTNLRSDMFDAFADYLTDVTKYYHDSLGITFEHLEPFNEPFSTWWKANGGQEGCYFSQEDQHNMIRCLYRALEQKDMLRYCSIAAMDANSIDEAIEGLKAYASAGDILPKINRIDVHSYFGKRRRELADVAKRHNKVVWQSESGPLSVGGNDVHQMMVVCDRIITDFKEMNPTAWIDWQLVADNSQIWGLLVGKYKEEGEQLRRGMSFYLRAHFSRYIKTGYQLVENDCKNALSAMSPDGKELVIVLSNADKTEKKMDASFGKQGTKTLKVHMVTTRAAQHFSEQLLAADFKIKTPDVRVTVPAQSVVTLVITGL